jgi:predicted XRE-type DNA-binding protein
MIATVRPTSGTAQGKKVFDHLYIGIPLKVTTADYLWGLQSGISQTSAAWRLNVNQQKVSALSNCQLEGFSVERLMNFLTALDRDVDIIIRRVARSRKGGRILVTP